MPELIPVRIEYRVERTVYVYADTFAEAKRLARDTTNWADEEERIEHLAEGEIVVKRA